MDQSHDWTTQNIWDNEHIHHHERNSFKKPLLCLKGSKLFSDPGYVRDLEVASYFKKQPDSPFLGFSEEQVQRPCTILQSQLPNQGGLNTWAKGAQFYLTKTQDSTAWSKSWDGQIGFIWFWKTKEFKGVSGVSASGFRWAFCAMPSWLQPACGAWLPSMERALPKNRSALPTLNCYLPHLLAQKPIH